MIRHTDAVCGALVVVSAPDRSYAPVSGLTHEGRRLRELARVHHGSTVTMPGCAGLRRHRDRLGRSEDSREKDVARWVVHQVHHGGEGRLDVREPERAMTALRAAMFKAA